jgi:hypothetical protein
MGVASLYTSRLVAKIVPADLRCVLGSSFGHVGLFASVLESAVGAKGKFLIREASIFPGNPVNVTDDCIDDTHVGLFASVFQSAVGAEGKLLMIREATIFPENPFNVADDCVDATHVGLFVSVAQSAAGAKGISLILEYGSVPETFSRYNELCVGAEVALIQPAICPVLADFLRSSLRLPINSC